MNTTSSGLHNAMVCYAICMDLKYGNPARHPFVTNVGLITSNGPHGHNVMAAEWTYQISYDPGLIAISVGPSKATHDNIEETKYFGVNIATEDQNAVASIAGGMTGKKVDKISALKDMGFTFSQGEHFDLLLVDDSALMMECKMIEQVTRGDHTVFIGEVVSIKHDETKKPLLYHDGKYWGVGRELPKPADEERKNMEAFVKKHTK